MSCAPQLSVPTRAIESSRKKAGNRARCFRIRCAFTQSNLSEEEDEAGSGRAQSQQHVVLVERYGNGTARRFILDDEWQVQTFDADHDPTKDTRLQGSQFSDTNLSWLPNVVKDFLLPAGFPGSVSDDYLGYMLLQFPTNVTGWICHAIVTSSLLKAVGIDSFSGTTAAASAAAIKWVSKDGIGAVGRLFIGLAIIKGAKEKKKFCAEYFYLLFLSLQVGALGIFSMMIQNSGACMQTSLAALEGCGKRTKRSFIPRDTKPFCNLRKSRRGSSKGGSLGSICPVVWSGIGHIDPESSMQDTPGLVRLYPVLSLTWLSIRLVHLWLRYQSLSVLQFNTINLKRARILVKSHVLNTSVPGCVDCNKEENILTWEKFMKPRIIFGVPLEDMVGGDTSVFKVKKLIRIYAKEKYILMVNQSAGDFEVLVSFKVGATSLSVLRSVWQVYWLHENRESFDNLFDWLSHSLLAMEDRFDDFIQRLKGAGWDTHQLNLKVPKEISIDEVGSLQ